MKKYIIKISNFRKNSYVKNIFILAGCLYVLLFVIAFVMKDHANHEWIKNICREYVYGPKNMVALVVNKIVPGMIEVDSVLIPPPPPAPERPPHEKAVKDVLERYKNQAVIDEQLKAEYESGGYTLDDPFVVVNPYGISPLTALIMFDTEDDMLATVKVVGKTQEEDVIFQFEQQGYSKKHIIPVYGLYADYDNTVLIIMSSRGGQECKKEIRIATDDLPDYLQSINLLTSIHYKDEYVVGLNFSESSIDNQGFKSAFDINGDIRWIFTDPRLHVATDFADGKFVYSAVGAGDSGEAVIIKESYLGRIEDIYYVPNGVHHDIVLTNHNSILVTTNHVKTALDDLVEINLSNGKIVSEIDYRKLLPRARFVGALHSYPRDWAHINSVVEHEGAYISSSNYQSAIIKHTNDGQIRWLLSDPQEYPGFWQQYLLVPEGENFEYPYNQHAIEVLPDYDNNPDTVDILLFDNGTSRNAMNKDLQNNIKMGRVTEPPLYSRMVHYRINEKNMTVRQIWQYGKERPELFAPTRGDANLLPNGNILGTFNQQRGAIDTQPKEYYYWNTVYVEVNRAGKVVWECYATADTEANKYLDYRLCRTNIYNSSVDYSHLLDESHNYVPDEIMKKYGY